MVIGDCQEDVFFLLKNYRSQEVIPYPAWTGAVSAEPYVRHMPHVRRVPDLDLMLPLHCWNPQRFKLKFSP